MSDFLITDEEIKEKYLTSKDKKIISPHVFTVKMLLDFIFKNEISMDAKIYTERIEDFYFVNNGWETKDKDSYEFEGRKDQYVEISSPILYDKNDKHNLYLTSYI